MVAREKTRKPSSRESAIAAIDEAIKELQLRRQTLVTRRRGKPPKGYIINPKTGAKDWYLMPDDPRLQRGRR